MDLRSPAGRPVVLDEDVWEDVGGGAMRRVWRKGQRITENQAVAAGLMRHRAEPKTEPLQADKAEPAPAKKRERRTGGKARKRRTVQDKARKRTEDK